MLGFIGGVIVGGAIMYYIQPAVKTAVAKMFGWEASLAAAYRQRAADLQAAALAKQTPPAPSK